MIKKILKSKAARILGRIGITFIVGVNMLFLALFLFAPVRPATDMPGAQSVRERISIYAREDSYVVNGKDLIFYSDDRSTQKLSIDGATGNVDAEGNGDFAGDLIVGGSASLGATGTFTTGQLIVIGTAQVDGAVSLNSTLDVDGAISSGTGAVTVTDNLQLNGNATVTGTLTLEGVAFSGPVTFGSASSVVSGTTIAHGLGTTPTVALLTAQGVVTTTPLVLSTDTVSITVAFVAGEAQAMTVNWLAGR